MAGVDLMEQLKLAYQLDRRSKFRFYLRLLFDQFDVALVDSHIVYKKLENKDLPLKEFKMCIEIESFLRQLKTVLSEPSSIQVHQSSTTWPNTSITFSNFLGNKKTMHCMLPSSKTEQNISYVFNM